MQTAKGHGQVFTVHHQGSGLACRVVSLDKELSTLSLFTEVYKWVRQHTAGGNPGMDQHPIQGGVAILLDLLYALETGISSGRVGL